MQITYTGQSKPLIRIVAAINELATSVAGVVPATDAQIDAAVDEAFDEVFGGE